MTSLKEIAEILKTTEANAETRARRLGLTVVCHRCLGIGHYSFNGSHSICYRCNGMKYERIDNKNINLVLENAKNCVKNGKLEEYLNYLRIRKEGKTIWNRYMEAWKASKPAINNPSHMKRDNEVSEFQLKARKDNAKIASFADKLMRIPVKDEELPAYYQHFEEAMKTIKELNETY